MEEAEKASKLADELLVHLSEKNIELNTCQAALGTAWVRLCRGMKFDKYMVKEMCQCMVDYFEE